jgi:hypothetical protein
MKKLNSTLFFRAFFLAALMIVSSCTQYIKLLPYQNINDYQGLTPESWSFRDYHNFIIIHFGEQIFELSNITYNQTNSTITGVINPTISTPLAYYNSVKNNPQNIHMMSKGDPPTLAEQIHLFVNKGQVKEDGRFEFSINDISQIDETVHQSKSNIGPGGTVALVAVSALTVGIIAVAVACGCPHVYINDGEELKWEQTLFTGATSPQLARSDLKAIKDYFPTQETLTLTLKNDEEEQQFIDKLSLKVVDHPADVHLAIENNGNLYAYHKATSPIAVTDQDGKNQSQATANKDGASYDFKPEKLTDLSALHVTFKPESLGKSRLILHVKNTKWSGYLYNEFNKLFGSEHAKWVEKNKDKSKEDREAWMRQEGIKLLVEVKRNNVWESLSEIDLIGDVTYKSLAVPIDVESLENLEIRLRSGFHFWEVDYLGLAHETENIAVKIHDLTPTIATNSQGESQLDKLQGTDEKYLISTPDNASTVVTFDNIPLPNQGKRSLFLEANGYYLIQKQYTGKPNYKRLSKFKKPGELSRFSKEQYTEFQKKFSFQ